MGIDIVLVSHLRGIVCVLIVALNLRDSERLQKTQIKTYEYSFLNSSYMEADQADINNALLPKYQSCC